MQRIELQKKPALHTVLLCTNGRYVERDTTVFPHTIASISF